MGAIILGACFLPQEETIYQQLDELGKQLLERDMHLVLVGSWNAPADYEGFHAIDFPFGLAQQGARFSEFYSSQTTPMSFSSMAEFEEIDRAWGADIVLPENRFFIRRAVAFWYEIFQVLQPSTVLCWGTTAPISRVMLRIAQNTETPAYVLERGFLEKTMIFSSAGQTALSFINTAVDLISPEETEVEFEEKFKRIDSYYRESKARYYEHRNKSLSSDKVAQIRKMPSPRVLFIGSNDVGSGLNIDYPYFARPNSPWVSTSEEGLCALISAMQRVFPNSSVLIKGHSRPLAAPDTSIAMLHLTDLDLDEIIQESDILVNLSSGAQIRSIFLRKPLISLSNSFLMGRGVAYEAFSSGELKNALMLAGEGDQLEERLRKGRALVAALFARHLIGLDDSVPTNLRLKHVVDAIARFRHVRSTNQASVAERLKSFLQLLEFAAPEQDHAGGTVDDEMLGYLLYDWDSSSWREHPDIDSNFDWRAYLRRNRDLVVARVDPFEHYVAHGKKEGRRCN